MWVVKAKEKRRRGGLRVKVGGHGDIADGMKPPGTILIFVAAQMAHNQPQNMGREERARVVRPRMRPRSLPR